MTQAVRKTTEYFGGKPGPGRPKGLPNQNTRLLKDALMLAAEEAGKRLTARRGGLVDYLAHQALEEPVAFMGLLGRVLPLQVTGNASDGALEIRWLPPEEPPKVIDADVEEQ